jgi:membrane-bound lytic murein transglycosylase A
LKRKITQIFKLFQQSTLFYKLFFAFFIVIILATENILVDQAAAETLSLVKMHFSKLPHWQEDKQNQALFAFQQSCKEIIRRNAKQFFGPLPIQGKVRDWQAVCIAAKKLINPNTIIARRFFEYWFDPYYVTNNIYRYGLFTGYYLPVLHANLIKNNRYFVPIYRIPNNLVKVRFYSARTGFITRKFQLKNQHLFLYPDRAAINQGAIDHDAKIIAWADNTIDVFFAQIQGSAIVELPNHHTFLIGYASDNGRTYTPIGRILVDINQLDKKDVSMQSIRRWLQQHPQQTSTLLNSNAAYVFFRILKYSEPLGTEQVPLTAERSLAVDPHYIALGAPLWLDTFIPGVNNKLISYQHLLIAQDTGSAIKGSIRGDVYWGSHKQADFLAGNMKSTGQYWILLPKMRS